MKFSTAYEQSKDAVYGYLTYMTKDIQLAEDLSQETFLKMFINIRKYKGTANIKTWALKIARNTFLTYAKKKQPILLEEQIMDLNPGSYQNEPEENILQKEKGEQIRKIMMTLNENERTILILRDYAELSYEEIAQIINTDVGALKSRLYRARQKFRKLYETSCVLIK
jgi:RNA polymerase sigma-70 factor (ECF subfamily)